MHVTFVDAAIHELGFPNAVYVLHLFCIDLYTCRCCQRLKSWRAFVYIGIMMTGKLEHACVTC